MAAPSSKPSSSPTPSRMNPVSRNSELNNPMRRSFSGNPFAKPSAITNPRALNSPKTPFNSPSDFRRRQSTDRESGASWRDFEDKENGKDPNPKPGRVRSPARSSVTKNFMSPTISAASKINPSPRKKILVERNEPARSSVSSSDTKGLIMEESELKQEMGFHQKESEGLESDSSLLAESTTSEEKDLVNLEATTRFEISPRVCSSSMPLAPLDADPSMPPYDPKTNYLSPRPQFLHYKPNPRIELYRGREGEQLEASLSDTDVTEETGSDDSQRELEDMSSSEVEKQEEEEELLVSVPASTVTDMAVESVEAKGMSKTNFFSGSKLVALLLLLVLASYSISGTDVSAYHHALEVFDSQGFQVPDLVAQLAKVRFDGLAQKVMQWSSDTLDYIRKISVREMPNPVPLQYANLSGLFDNNLDHGHLMFEQIVMEPPITEIETEDRPVDGDDDQWKPEEDEFIGEAIETEQETCEEAEDNENSEFFSRDYEGVQAQAIEVEQVDNFEVVSEDHVTASEQQIGTKIMEVNDVEGKQVTERAEISASQTAIQLPDFMQEHVPLSEQNTNSAEIACGEAELRPENIQLEASSMDNAQGSQAAQGKFSGEDVPVISLAILCLCAAAAAAVLLAKKKNSASKTAPAEQVPAEKFNNSLISVAAEQHAYQERSSSRNLQTDLVDLVSQSGPSQMSSFQKSSRELDGCSEAQSQERRLRNNYRRESLASSDYSVGGTSPSHSYGSFTT